MLTNQSVPFTKARFQNKNRRPRCIKVGNGPLINFFSPLTDNCDIADNISVCMRHYNVTKPTKRPQTRTTSLLQSTATKTDSTSSATQPPVPGLPSTMLMPFHSKLLPNLIGKVSFAMKRRNIGAEGLVRN